MGRKGTERASQPTIYSELDVRVCLCVHASLNTRQSVSGEEKKMLLRVWGREKVAGKLAAELESFLGHHKKKPRQDSRL